MSPESNPSEDGGKIPPDDSGLGNDDSSSLGPNDAGIDHDSGDADADPPRPSCGADSGVPCGLGHACTVDSDCTTSARCGKHSSTCLNTNSCVGAAGANQACAGSDCCESIAVPGGAFENVDNDTTVETASVPPFKLDKFEVTVGRFRAFVNATGGNMRGNPPAAGAGAKPTVPGSGWRTSFNARLPGSKVEVDDRLTWACAVGGNNLDYGAATWTAEPGPNEDKPINCIDWYTLFAFCAWDDARLPSDAEWSYVALSGNEKRVYPYGNETPTWSTHFNIFDSRLPNPPNVGTTLFTQGPQYRSADDGPLPIAPVGLKTERSKWGHADLTGNIIEQTIEKAQGLPGSCNDCANVNWPDPPQNNSYPRDWKLAGGEFSDQAAALDGIRLARGSSWQGETGGHWMKNTRNRFWLPVWRTYSAMGGRCARDIK